MGGRIKSEDPWFFLGDGTELGSQVGVDFLCPPPYTGEAHGDVRRDKTYAAAPAPELPWPIPVPSVSTVTLTGWLRAEDKGQCRLPL